MEYNGEDNLSVMKMAYRYNAYLIDMVINQINSSAKKILDFGSGDGYFARRISKNLKKDIICLEPADNLQKHYKGSNIKSLEEVASNSIDAIYSFNVLEHIENDKDIVDNFYKVLRKNGEVLLYLPAFSCLYSAMDKMVGHYRRYTKKDIARLFDNDKWQIDRVVYADFVGFFVTIIFKIIGNKQGKVSPLSIKIYDKFLFPISLFFDKITKGRLLGKNIIIKVTKK